MWRSGKASSGAWNPHRSNNTVCQTYCLIYCNATSIYTLTSLNIIGLLDCSFCHCSAENMRCSGRAIWRFPHTHFPSSSLATLVPQTDFSVLVAYGTSLRASKFLISLGHTLPHYTNTHHLMCFNPISIDIHTAWCWKVCTRNDDDRQNAYLSNNCAHSVELLIQNIKKKWPST